MANTASIRIVSRIRSGTPSPMLVRDWLWRRAISAGKRRSSHLCHWNGFGAPLRLACWHAIFDRTWNWPSIRIIITCGRARIVSIGLVRVEMRQRRDGIRVGSDVLIKVGSRVVVCERQVTVRGSVEARTTGVLDGERMRIDVSGDMVVKIRPFDSFVVIKVGEAVPSEFPDEESNDTEESYAACDR